MKTTYLPRIIDSEIKLKLKAFGALYIEGPKWCGKTTTGLHFCKSFVKLQNDYNQPNLIESIKLNPTAFLNGDKPRLIDEWQDAPVIWDAIRNYSDENEGFGHFILTGSTSKKVKTRHTGTGRISTIKMYPMSLYESKESTGSISLKKLFDKTEILGANAVSKINFNELIFAACRGGWPSSLIIEGKEAQLLVAKDYYKQIYSKDIFNIDNKKRNPNIMRTLLTSYARNISTLANNSTILKDVSSHYEISRTTIDDYINVLEQLFIVQDIDAWCPSIRSKDKIRSSKKREFIDPSLAVAALSLNPKILEMDVRTFGFIFETMCIRDLRVYSSKLDGEISYFHDKYDLEADAVLHLDDGRYALIEFKLGGDYIDEGAKHLNKIEKLIIEHNEKDKKHPISLPTFKMIITGTQFGYKRPDGIFVVPLGCLKD